LIQREKQEQQGDRVNFLQGPSIDLHVRRNYIYEDAFDKLSPDNEANLRLKMRVQLVNAAGLDEAGIDGGGLFREFLSQLLKAAFDPNRGFFTLTRDQMLYPSPSAAHIHPDAAAHYYFIGRMLGKAMYENLLVELPLAPFFVSKLLGQTLDIDHLDSLDPELYRNLLALKTYEGDVQDYVGIDFTVVVEEFGQTRIELLKPEGDSIPVTSENRIEYIHLVADYKLNRQIKAQCSAFRNGLADVIGLDWLRMFSSRELSILISGSEQDIGMDDLMAHTNYSGGYEAGHPTIQAFWAVVTGLEEVAILLSQLRIYNLTV
jgi:ubiquitin-protein ligase E3 C